MGVCFGCFREVKPSYQALNDSVLIELTSSSPRFPTLVLRSDADINFLLQREVVSFMSSVVKICYVYELSMTKNCLWI